MNTMSSCDILRVSSSTRRTIFVGKIAGIRDGAGFHSDNLKGMRAAFREGVEDYRVACAKIGNGPQKPYSESH